MVAWMSFGMVVSASGKLVSQAEIIAEKILFKRSTGWLLLDKVFSIAYTKNIIMHEICLFPISYHICTKHIRS